MGRLTTHVLDTAHGRPAEGVPVRLLAQESGAVLAESRTNADGRCPQPLLEGERFEVGAYVLEFRVAAYFRACGAVLADPPFLDKVAIAFAIADEGGHYHVPLLISPYGYATYRGS